MATVAIAQQPHGVVAIPSKVYTPSKLELSKPFTRKIHRIIINETEKLIKQRNDLEQALVEATERSRNGPRSNDGPSREDIIKLSHELGRREAEHIRLRKKLIEKRKQLYRWSPSRNRELDLELLQALQWKFKRNLTTCLSDCERSVSTKEAGSGTTTDGDKRNQHAIVSKASANSGPSGQSAGSEKDDSHNDRRKGAPMGSISNLDGSFDDYAREASKKRKLADEPTDLKVEVEVEKERRQQAKKEQKPNKDQTPGLGSLSLSTSGLQEEVAPATGNIPAIDSMFQSKKKLNFNGKKALFSAKESDASTIKATTGSSSDNVKTKNCKINAIQTNSSSVNTSSTQNESLVEPWYKLHARAMMDPEFNDKVYYRPSRKRKRPHSDVYVHGALPEPREVVKGGWPLPTPPMSSPSLSPSCSSQSETGRTGKSRGKTNNRKRRAHPGNARDRGRLSAPEPSRHGSLASGPSTAGFSVSKAPRPTQKFPSNVMSAS